ncbi:inositol/phosphatidylinositol phosphatase [Calocera viscosa TUFC12733]|uniref:Inositol/phosphatidylinositol phosphatase n=1 Tax=Calocera viscosa (strain TUFC12733) TaxID=1330018 RepID=A0A167M398_CALVF|nr:inositol/phosphatidylinositol phosphatase [Calocera viscosa TUFC12733]
MSANYLHTSYNLYISPDAYTFEPVVAGASEPNETLVIDRRSGSINLNPAKRHTPVAHERVITVYGIMGILSLTTADFLIVIINRARHGRLIGSEIYLATDFKVLPIPSTANSAQLLDHPVEKKLLTLVKSHLDSGRFWFSYGWDLTRRLQAQWDDVKKEGEGLWRKCDEKFWWNRYLSERLIEVTEQGQDLSRFILPVVYGTFDIRHCVINARPFLFCVISRRSRYRAGTRYFARGIDATGHVANFIESEQLVLLDPEGHSLGGGRIEGRTRLSFVQTRGSTPIFWAEITTLRYKPDLQIMEVPETTGALRAHLEEMSKVYGTVYLVNLVNQKGREKPIKEAYEKYVLEANVPTVKYEYFDFHHECRNMRWDRIQLLIDRLQPALKDRGYFHQELGQPTPVHLQTAVVRSNCMDCLDRTNVVQSALARWSLLQQLRVAGVLGKEERLEDYPDFLNVFREVWADHGDAISYAYAGTGALKADYTRTGKRTREGLINDGVNATTRYFRNNFTDGPRQDAYDLLTGAWRARRGGGVGGWEQRSVLVRGMPYVLLFAVVMLLAGAVLPRSASRLSILPFNILFVLLAFLASYFIAAHGVSYVNWPRLTPPLDTLTYAGPGFKSPRHGRGDIGVPLPVPLGLAAQKEKGRGRLNSAVRVEEMEMGGKKRTD